MKRQSVVGQCRETMGWGVLRVWATGLALAGTFALPAAVTPAGQRFGQEMARGFAMVEGLPTPAVQLLDVDEAGGVRVFADGHWAEWSEGGWRAAPALAAAGGKFRAAGQAGKFLEIDVAGKDVLQLVRRAGAVWVITTDKVHRADGGAGDSSWQGGASIRQAAVTSEGRLVLATRSGLQRQTGSGWEPVTARDDRGLDWAAGDVLGVCEDAKSRLWFACRAGVACQNPDGWKFYTGREGLPWNDFTGMAAAPDGAVWMATRLGVIRFDGVEWQYRQGRRWLPNDEVKAVAVDGTGRAWMATPGGVGMIERRPMTLAEKAAHYEDEIARYVKRTPFGFVAEAPLRVAADRSTAAPQDSDNDGLWTAMYGAGECFAYAATGKAEVRERARQAFEALRFLQKVTQGGEHAPAKGYVARTVRPVDWPDPNVGRVEADRESQKHDAQWKVYEPRWPRSADGKWYWKSDTSSDELDGHYFFYPLYYDFCAETEAEKERVREVVRDLTDHLVSHGFSLVDHDGKPTRWGIYGPQDLNRDPRWWGERGLKSLSMLSYLAVAEHVTGDAKYAAVSRELIDRHGYAHNLMYPKVQHGPGSGNQSDDEMAVMCFYSLLRLSKDEELKAMARYSFYRYWANEAPEMNPFFHFAYVAMCQGRTAANAFGEFPLSAWEGWQADSMATLYGFPLDRLNWACRNSHRLDLQWLSEQASVDIYEPRRRARGYRVDGRVLPVENRHFNHWNTDPWHLDYGGDGNELGAGTVFLLPYYMGMYHGFIEKGG